MSPDPVMTPRTPRIRVGVVLIDQPGGVAVTYVPNAHRRPRRARILLLLLTLVLTGLATWTTTAPAVAAPCDAPVVNPVACENTKPGTPETTWDVAGSGNADIQGFATDISVNQGETVGFKVKTNASSYRLDIYRMGYYGGDGARQGGHRQPDRPADPARLPRPRPHGPRRLRQLGPVGVLAGAGHRGLRHLLRACSCAPTAPSGASHIVFVVRDDASHSDLLFQTSDTTWQAYNSYGGNSLYTGSPAGRAYKVSYNRPFTTRANGARGLRLQRRVPDGALPRVERLRRQLHHRRRHRPPRRRLTENHKTLPVGRPRRVLVGRPARQRRGSPATPG